MSQETQHIDLVDSSSSTSCIETPTINEFGSRQPGDVKSIEVSNSSELFNLCPEMYDLVVRAIADYALREMREHKERMKELMREGRNS